MTDKRAPLLAGTQPQEYRERTPEEIKVDQEIFNAYMLRLETAMIEPVNTFTCAGCHGTFDKTGTDEERDAEATEIFGKHPKDWKDQAMVICDDCFNLMDLRKNPEKAQETKRFL